jgi:hypothetical protein
MERKPHTDLKIGDKVSIRYKQGTTVHAPDVIRIAAVTKVTPAAIYADGKQILKDNLFGT